MKSAILEISPEMFQTVFQLPTDAKVVGVLTDIYRVGVLRIKLVGVGPDIAENQRVQIFKGTCTAVRGDDGALIGATIDWGLPPNDSFPTLVKSSIEQFFNAWTTGSGIYLLILPCRLSDLYEAYCRYCRRHEIKARPQVHLNGFLLAHENWVIKKCKITHWENNEKITTIELVVFPPESLVAYLSRDKVRPNEDYIRVCMARFKASMNGMFG